MMITFFDTPYSLYIGSAYIITIVSGAIFTLLSLLKLRAIKKKINRLEQASRYNDC